jgi:O-antigen/teichoic acid export membrane protein
MQRKFFTNLGLLLLFNLLIKPFWVFGIDRTVQNIVGAEEYGFYFTVFNFSFLFNILLDLGITNFNNRNIAQNNQLLSKHFSGIVSLRILLGLLYFAVVFILAYIWGYRGAKLSMLALVGFNQFLLQFLLYLRSNISGLLLFKTESFLSVLDRSLMILIMSLIIWGGFTESDFKIEWFVYGQTAGYILAVTIVYYIVVFKSKSLKINWNPVFFLMILRKSAPFAMLILLMAFYNRIDTVMLEKLLPDVEGEIQVGIYAHAYRILDAANQISYLFAVFLLPLFSHMIKMKSKLDAIIIPSFSIIFIGTFVLAIISFFYSHEIMELLYIEYIDASSQVFNWLIFGVVATAISYIFGTLLTANGNLKELIIIALGSLFLSLVLNGLLIPLFMAKGSAIANLSALGFGALAQIITAYKKLNFKFHINYVLRLFGAITMIVLIAYFSTLLTAINWSLRIVIVAAISLIIGILFKLLNIQQLFSFYSSNTELEK